MPRTGRPPIFDQVKQQLFLRFIAAGFSARDAARQVGVSPSTVREKRRASPAFAAAYDKAKGQAIPTLLESIHNAGQRSWRASAWLLERLRPANFGRRVALGMDPALPRPKRRPRAYMDEEVINEFFGRLWGNREAQALSRQKLEQIEADQEAWDAAKKAYHEQYTLRGRSPGFGPGQWHSAGTPHHYDYLDRPTPSPDSANGSTAEQQSPSANNSDLCTPSEIAQVEPPQPQPTTTNAASP